MTLVRKNGKAYDSGDVIVTVDGVPSPEVAEISYTTEQEHKVNHSLGNEATSYSMGKINRKASIKIYMALQVALERKAPGRSLMRLKPFNVNVTYLNDDNILVNDILTVKFQSQGREVTGEMGLAMQYDLLALGIEYQKI